MIDCCVEVLDAWVHSVLNKILRSTHYVSTLPDEAVLEETNQLVTFIWLHKIYLEKHLIKVFIYFALKWDIVKHLKIPEECASILNRMMVMRWDRYFEECHQKRMYRKPHTPDATFPNFMSVEQLKIKETYANEDIAERIYYALYPCSIPKYNHVPGDDPACRYSAEHRCVECRQLYCSDHQDTCKRYSNFYKCQSCAIRIPLCDKYTSPDLCRCGFSKICKELLAEL